MKQIRKIRWELGRYFRMWVECPVERWYGAVRYRLVVRPRLDIKVWRQFGSPVEFYPRRAFLLQSVVGFLQSVGGFFVIWAWAILLALVLFRR